MMTEGVSVQEVIASGDPEQVRAKLLGLLHFMDDGVGPTTIYCAQLCLAELERLAVEKVEQSSRRLEKLTRALIVLTVVLLIFTIPLTIDVVRHWFGK